jgi:translation initiation factor IF-3
MEGTTLHAIIAPAKKAEVQQPPAAPKPKPVEAAAPPTAPAPVAPPAQPAATK